ncbi:hypothetical protein Patl1_24376 [Pistacia atlantica]|uniref:Uncharacterized protein n=1 Tax=Pistacia atlantica TaxID=434234 RepID=A0ACC1A2P9_9ROSI|nr:hypothetical protein Patl1_24376 [Pistacia atlantica]
MKNLVLKKIRAVKITTTRTTPTMQLCCGEDFVEAVTVEKAGECLSFPRYVVGETKLEASKEGHTLKDFKLDNALTSTANQLIPPTPATYTSPVEQLEVVIGRCGFIGTPVKALLGYMDEVAC